MKELGLQELLRYALSGGVGVASLLLMYPNIACLIGHIDGAGEVTLILGAILVFGTLVYNIHRALLFPPFFRAIGLITISPKESRWERFKQFLKFWRWWSPSPREIDLDRWRWGLEKKHRERWNAWAAHAHFLYCAAWATAAAFVSGRYIAFGSYTGEPPSCHARLIFVALFGSSLVAGAVNNYRLLYYINDEKNQKQAAPQV